MLGFEQLKQKLSSQFIDWDCTRILRDTLLFLVYCLPTYIFIRIQSSEQDLTCSNFTREKFTVYNIGINKIK